MKRTVKFILCAVLLTLTLCACSKNEALGLVLSFRCENSDNTWLLETTKQGVVDLVGEAQKDEKTGDLIFVFEAVGEGETELDFYCVKLGESDISKATYVKKYKVTVNSDFEITSELITDESITIPAVKLTCKEEAEAYLSQSLDVLKNDDSNEYVIKYKGTYTENNITWYKFSLSKIITLNDGRTVLRFTQMYAVSENGEIKTLDEGKDTPDIELNNK